MEDKKKQIIEINLKLYTDPDIIAAIKSNYIRWLGDKRTLKKTKS